MSILSGYPGNENIADNPICLLSGMGLGTWILVTPQNSWNFYLTWIPYAQGALGYLLNQVIPMPQLPEIH